MTFAPIDPDLDPEEIELEGELKGELSESDMSDCGVATKEKARLQSLAKLQNSSLSPPERVSGPSASDVATLTGKPLVSEPERPKAQAKVKRRQKANGPDAVILLKEEKVEFLLTLQLTPFSPLSRQAPSMTSSNLCTRSASSSLNSWNRPDVYYGNLSLACTITWNNVEGLMNISHKLSVTGLQKECLTFLLTHAAGRPIKAMRIAELFSEEELYRESSRFVLDNPGGWTEQELSTLSPETLLKLEKR